MGTTPTDAPRGSQSEPPEEPDPMARHYGRDAWSVAKELFGEDFTTPGVLYSDVDDVPHEITNDGDGYHDLNMLTGEYAGGRGFDGDVISRAEAERLVRSRIRGYQP